MKKKYSSFLVILSVSILNAQEHRLEKLWETDSVIAVPESLTVAAYSLK